MNKFLSLTGLTLLVSFYSDMMQRINSRIGETKQNIIGQVMPLVNHLQYLVVNFFMHRNITTNRDLTDAWYNGNMKRHVQEGNFENIHPGDYIIGQNSGVTYYVADMDLYYYHGEAPNIVNYHHLIMVPGANLGTAKMNDTYTTAGGYLNSKMKQTTLPAIINNYLTPDFGSNLKTYSALLGNAVNTTIARETGLTGATSGCEWVASQCDLLNEANVYGHSVFGNGRDCLSQQYQLAIFKMWPTNYIFARDNVWLRDVASEEIFAVRSYSGDAAANYAVNENGVRPFFLIG